MIHLPTRLLLAATAILLALPASARDLEVLSRLDAVTVYPDGASVVRLIPFELQPGETTLVARDFPASLDPQSIRVEGSGTAALSVLGVAAKALQVEDRPAGADELKLDALKLEREGVKSRIEALEARKRFAERYGKDVPFGPGEKEARVPFAEWRQAFSALGDEIEAAGKALIEVRERARKLDRDIARLEQDLKAKPATRLEVRIDVSADAAAKGTLKVTYAVKTARWTPLYDARLTAGKPGAKPSLELVRRAEIVQTSGEDWTEVALGVSTVRTAGGTKAPETQPLLVRFYQPPRPAALGAPMMSKRMETLDAARAPAPAAPPADTMPATEQEAAAEEGALQVVWQVQGRVSVGSGEGGRVLRLASAKVEPELQVKVSAATDTTPYLEASFKQCGGGAAAAGPRCALSRWRLCRRGPPCRRHPRRDGDARLRRRRAHQGHAHRAAPQGRPERHRQPEQDRAPGDEDHGAQRPRRAGEDHGGGPHSAERGPGHPGRAVAERHAAHRQGRRRQARRSGLELRLRPRREPGDPVRLAAEMAGRPPDRDRDGTLTSGKIGR